MANLNGVSISEGQIGANVIDRGDGISGLLVVASAAPAALQFGEVKTFFNMNDVEAAGITQAYDTAQNENVWRHASEFYRMAGEGQKLYFMLADSATLTISSVFDDVNGTVKELITSANGEIKQFAVAANETAAEITVLNGIAANVYNAIPKAQALHVWAKTNNMPCNILLEGYSYTGGAAAAADLRAIENVKADKVSVVIGQDFKYADGMTDNAQLLADVGTALGTLSAATVEQNIGDNEAFNLTDATLGAWLVPGLSSHQKNIEVFSDLQTLEDKGYIFGYSYVGLEGVRWNNDHVCTEVIQDAQGNINQHTIAYGRVHDKAIRLLRTALLPKVKKSYPVDPSTGRLSIGTQKYFKGLGDTVFADMVRRKEISSGEMFVDATSDLVTEKVLKTSYVIVPYGTVGEITGTSNLKTSI